MLVEVVLLTSHAVYAAIKIDEVLWQRKILRGGNGHAKYIDIAEYCSIVLSAKNCYHSGTIGCSREERPSITEHEHITEA